MNNDESTEVPIRGYATFKPERSKKKKYWWENPKEEFEIPLGYPENQDTDEEDIDIYHKRREYWLEDKIQADFNQQYELLKLGYLEDKNKQREVGSEPLLPPQRVPRKMTLILDMDETLLHTSPFEFTNYDTIAHGVKNEKIEYDGFVSHRPYLHDFLTEMKEIYEIVLFTAGEQYYADEIIKTFDPDKKYLDFILCREKGAEIMNGKVKDLANIGRPLDKTLLVDNSLYSFARNLNNGVPILDYFNDKNDVELKFLKEELKKVYERVTGSVNKHFQDVRNYLSTKYRLELRVRERYDSEYSQTD